METLRNGLLVAAVAIAGYQLPPALMLTVSAASADAGNPVDGYPADREITLPAGTPLSLRLGTTVSSAGSHIEQPVDATLLRSVVVNGVTVVPSGSAVSGYVSQLQRSGRVKGRALIGVRFNRLRVGDTRYTIRTASVSRRAPATKKADATKIGIGAGAGALVGALTGGKKGAAIGAGVGGAGGTAVVLSTRGKEVALGRGTVVTARLSEPLTIRVPRREVE